jgi:hypothetical protein
MLVMLRAKVQKLLSVTECAALVVPTNCVPKVKLAVESVAFGPEVTPMPLSGTE